MSWLKTMTSEELSVRLSKLEKDTDLLVSEIPRATTAVPEVEEWSDELLMLLRANTYFPTSRRTQAHVKDILSRFYFLYFFGMVDESDSVIGVIADAVAIGGTKNGNLWENDAFSDNCFYDPPRNSVDRFKFQYEDLPEVKYSYDLNDGFHMTDIEMAEDHFIEYTVKDAFKFKQQVFRLIHGIELNRDSKDVCREIVIRLTTFLALTLWRAATKNKYQLGNVFLSSQYRTNVTFFTDWPIENGFSPPCKECINTAVKYLRNGLITTSCMYIILVSEYVKTRDSNYSSDLAVADLLSTSVLTSTAGYGIEIIQLLRRATVPFNISWIALRKLSYFNITANNWDQIVSFFETYLKKNHVQYGYHWARIIDIKYLRNYSIKKMLPLAGILVSMIEQNEGSDILCTTWVNKYRENLYKTKQYGVNIYKRVTFFDKIIAADSSAEILQQSQLRSESKDSLELSKSINIQTVKF